MKTLNLENLKRKLKRQLDPPKWEDLRSVKPISDVFGIDRGTPIDRIYMEDFLTNNKLHIRGNVLEIASSDYSEKFGHDVHQYGVLSPTSSNVNATIIGDLTDIKTLPKEMFDCFICTQTLNFIYDFKSAIHGSWHLLKPGGVLLLTVAGISQISRYDMDRWGDYWRFTTKSIEKSFCEFFEPEKMEVGFYGNVLTAISFLEGISAEELSRDELFVKDPNYQLLITLRVEK